MKKTRTSSKTVFGIIVFLILMILLTILAFPYVKLLARREYQLKFIHWASTLGIRGWFAVLGIQILQIVIALIPGGPIEILAGMLYGGIGGLLTCMAGSIIASCFIFILAGKLGAPLVAKLFQKKNVDRFVFLKDTKKTDTIIFILFLIPGIPKDMLTYIAGTVPLKMSRFLLVSTFARIPALAMSTFIGSTVRQGQWKIAILIFSLTAVTGIAGICFKDRIIAACKKVGMRIRHRKD